MDPAPHERARPWACSAWAWALAPSAFAGGWINQWFGWQAFFVVGLPGLLIALVVVHGHRTDRAPEGLNAAGDASPFTDVIRFLIADRCSALVLGVLLCLRMPPSCSAARLRTRPRPRHRRDRHGCDHRGLLGALGVLACEGRPTPRVAPKAGACVSCDRLDAGDAPAHRDGCCRLTLARLCAVHRSRDRRSVPRGSDLRDDPVAHAAEKRSVASINLFITNTGPAPGRCT